MGNKERKVYLVIMKKAQFLSAVCLLAGSVSLYAQAPAPKGDAAKGKEYFDGKCGICHDALTTDKKMGPGLKGLYKRPKVTTTGKPTNDANVFEKIAAGGNGMPPMADLTPAEKAKSAATKTASSKATTSPRARSMWW